MAKSKKSKKRNIIARIQKKRHNRKIRQRYPRKPAKLRKSTNPGSTYRSTRIESLTAPTKMFLLGEAGEETFTWFEHLRNSLNSTTTHTNKNVDSINLDFSNTTHIDAATMLTLLAQVDYYQKIKNKKLAITQPKDNKIRQVFCQIGFDDFFSTSTYTGEINHPEVKYWRHLKGNLLDLTEAGEIIEEIASQNSFSNLVASQMYRVLSEAVSNVVMHAYSHARFRSQERSWWSFMGVKDDYFNLVVCDLGIGIPLSLRTAARHKKWRRLLDARFKSDHWLISTSFRQGRSSSELPHRGHGMKELKGLVNTTMRGDLIVFSGKGYYHYQIAEGKKEERRKGALAQKVQGTIVAWRLPISSLRHGEE